MQHIDSSILQALKSLRGDYPSTAAMARALGLSASLLSRVLAGRAKAFTADTWDRIAPIVKPRIVRTCYMGYAHCPLEVDQPWHAVLSEILEIINQDWYEELLPVVRAAKEKWLKKHPEA